MIACTDNDFIAWSQRFGTALIYASKEGNVDVVMALLAAGANMEVKDSVGDDIEIMTLGAPYVVNSG